MQALDTAEIMLNKLEDQFYKNFNKIREEHFKDNENEML
jgi:hypothetical protein